MLLDETSEVNREGNQAMALKDDWKVDLQKTAFVTIDIQTAYLEPGAPRECAEGRKFISKVNELATMCRQMIIPVIHVRNFFRKDLSDMGLIPEIRSQTDSDLEATEGKRGCEFYKDLQVNQTDYIVNKVRNSAFISGSSSLESLLRNLGRDSLIMCGVMTDVCVATTVANAMMLGFRVILAGDLTATSTPERQKVALQVINQHFARVTTFEQLRNELLNLVDKRNTLRLKTSISP